RHAAGERRHAIGPSLHDGGVDVLRRAAVDPLLIHEWWTHPSAAIRVTAGAVVPTEQPLSFRDGVRVVLVGIGHVRRVHGHTGLQCGHAYDGIGRYARRRFAEAPLLTLAGDGAREEQDGSASRCDLSHGSANTYSVPP